MIGRADIEGSKSNVAMNAWLPQASSFLPTGRAWGRSGGPNRPATIRGSDGARSPGDGLRMTGPVSVPPSLPAPRFAADTAGRRGALSSRSSPYLKPLEGDLQPEPSLHYSWILFDMDLSRPEFCFFSRSAGARPVFFLVFSNGLTEFCFFFWMVLSGLRVFSWQPAGSVFFRLGVLFWSCLPLLSFLSLVFCFVFSDGWVDGFRPTIPAHMTHTLPSVEPSG